MRSYFKKSFTYLPRIIISLICLGLIFYIFYFTTPPQSWEQASILQILALFLPILILGTVLADIFFKYLPKSFLVGLGIVVITVLQALRQLTPLIAIGILAAAILGARLFPKVKTKEVKNIRKLGLSSEPKKSKLSKLRRHKQ